MNIRELALKALYDIFYNGEYSNIAVKKALSGESLTNTQKSFFTRLVYGVLDKEITLDYIIGSFSKIKLKKISDYILVILRMGIYQLKFMDSVPVSAAVNESVKLARRYGHGASAGFVNGILRNIARSEIEYPNEGVRYLSVRYSFAEDMCQKWINDFGFEFTEELMKAFEKPAQLILRPNTLKTDAQRLCAMLLKNGIKAESFGEYIKAEGFDIAKDDLYLKGMYSVQDTAAMQPAVLLAPKPGDYVIDMCAAPGGKTVHMAEIMKNKGKISAFDIYDHKIELIRKNAQRLGIDIIEAQRGDALMYREELRQTADKVLCDVPCTGTGIIGRKPDIKRNRRKDGSITEIQYAILKNGAAYLKKGADLLYSTCSIEREENEGVTDRFIMENAGFEKIYEKTYYPHTDGCDGFYVCRIKAI